MKLPRITPAFISTVNINIEILLKTHIYSIMILIIVMHSFTETNTQHCYNKSHKIPIGVLHDPVTTKSYQISTDMDIETMLHTMYFTGNTHTVTKINQTYQTISNNTV